MYSKLYSFIFTSVVVATTAVNAHAQYINTVAGNGVAAYTGDGGAANMASFNAVEGMAVDGAGNIYLADKNNNVVRKISNSGVVTTFAGTGVAGYSGNGGAATAAKLNTPSAVATDGAGNVYIAERGNHVVRVVNTAGKIKVYAGSGIEGYSGDGDTAHLGRISTPTALCMDGVGNLYIAEGGSHVIRRVDNGTRIMHTVAGTGSFGNTGDGGMATNATFNTPSGVVVDALGNVYIADAQNNRVRRVDAVTGMVSTVIGTGTPGNTGDGGPATAATVSAPVSVALDMMGNLYVVSRGFHNVRMVNSAGNISHVAGTGAPGYSGDGGLAVTASLRGPRFVFVDGWSRIYIGDQGNNVIRQLSATASVGNVAALANGFRLYPIPAGNTVHADLTAMSGTVEIRIINATGTTVFVQKVTGGQVLPVSITGIAPGMYTVSVAHAGAVYTQKLVKTAE